MYLIAETAWHHQGDEIFLLNLVKKLVKNSKADIIKIHLSIDFDEYMSIDHYLYKKQKKWLIDENTWQKVIKIILNSKKKIMMLFNDKKSIDFGMKFNPDYVEIHSVCLSDFHLINYLKKKISKKTNLVIGVGGTEIPEIKNFIKTINHKKIILMHGFQNYPTDYKNINLNRIKKIIDLFPNYLHGYADHTFCNDSYNALISVLVSLNGMTFLEKHVTTNFLEKRIDWESAISISKFNEISDMLNLAKKINGTSKLELNKKEKIYSKPGIMKKIPISKKI